MAILKCKERSGLMFEQMVEAKEAGAAGVLGTVANVCGPKGSPVLSSYAAAIGLDCPVEVSSSMCYIANATSVHHRMSWPCCRRIAASVCCSLVHSCHISSFMVEQQG